jgi:hypothetical protein
VAADEGYLLPSALLAQYPALEALNWSPDSASLDISDNQSHGSSLFDDK